MTTTQPVVAMGVALSPQLLNNAEMATPAAVYGAVAPCMALTFVFAVRRLRHCRD